MAQKTLDLLEKLMAGHIMTPAELDDILKNRVAEDLFLDYKHGNELSDPKKAAKTIRQYLSGFANSAGGILVIGVDERFWNVTGCEAPDDDLARWAADCLVPIAAYFSPFPRFQVVPHPDGAVLVAATSRSLSLIACIEAGERVYYFRLQDKTLKAPEYLISDIVLGRRQHPYLLITQIGADTLHGDGSAINVRFFPTFTVENQGFIWAEDIRIGMIGMLKFDVAIALPISDYLTSYIDVPNINEQKYNSQGGRLVHAGCSINSMEPFARKVVSNAEYIIPAGDYIWKAAVYLLSRGAPPIWYQVCFAVNGDLQMFMQTRTDLPGQNTFLTIQRLSGERPVVAWEDI